ncbi:MAG TPA: hypothetical protein VF763_12965 [Candidatus Limnocylindrales bacterium]
MLAPHGDTPAPGGWLAASDGAPAVWPPAVPSDAVTDLQAALAALADATDAVAFAVRKHDHAALLEANLRADALVAEVGRRTADLSPQERLELDAAGVPALCERLRAAARRNALLIERAWAIDAATMRLLAALARPAEPAADAPSAAYGPAGPAGAAFGADRAAYLDRQA